MEFWGQQTPITDYYLNYTTFYQVVKKKNIQKISIPVDFQKLSFSNSA